jgi:hypothetical protein
MSTVRLDVISIETDAVVHSVDVSGRSERSVERVLMGMLTQIDMDRYYVAEVSGADS